MEFSQLSKWNIPGMNGWICEPSHAIPKAILLVVHGLGEHVGRYTDFARHLASHSIATVAFDQQGHGNRPGKRGLSRGYESMLGDIHNAAAEIAKHWQTTPRILLGTSMGGNLAANYVLRGSQNWDGLILVAPMLLPAKPPRREQILAAWLTGKIFPFLKLKGNLQPSDLTQDPSEAQAIQEDPLMHSQISLRLATELLGHGRWALDQARNFDLPMLVLHGEQDRTVELAASSALCTKVGQKAKMISLPNMLHDIFHETDRLLAFEHIHQWILDVIDPDSAVTTVTN